MSRESGPCPRLSTLVVCLVGLAEPALADGAADLESLRWFTGCWAGDGQERGTGESWTPLAGGTILGVARTVREGRTIAHEFVQIRLNEAGRVVYIARPSGQAETAFELRRSGPATPAAQTAVFENAQHDFPQRVIYRRDGDRLLGRIEGSENGMVKGFDFPMHRTGCE